MIGLGFLLFFTLWSLGCALVSWLFAKQLPVAWRPWVWLALFFVLTPSILIDEIIGKQQFDRLCQEHSAVYIAPDARGRTVYLPHTVFEPIKGIWLRGFIQKWRYVDVKTQETIVSYNWVFSTGGWFMRSLELNAPLLYYGKCYPANEPRDDDFKAMGINYIELPDRKANHNQ